MKKFFIFIVLVLAVAFPFMNVFSIEKEVLKADATVISLTNINFVSEIANPDNTNFKLTENIILNSWSPIDFNGTLDGNGYTITLSGYLFNTIENASITNLGIIVSGTYTFDNTQYVYPNSDFGALAQNAKFSSINKVFAVASFQVKSKSSVNVGGLVGKIEGTNIKDSYVKTNITVNQYSEEALSTIVGGFVGNSVNSVITNCFAVPISTNILNVNVDNTLTNPKTKLILGGFIGLAERGTIGIISNNYCGGNLVYNYGGEVVQGKIFGEVKNFSDDRLSYCHTYNNQSELTFIGQSNSYTNVRITERNSIFFGESANFLLASSDGGGAIWNFLYVWNLDTVWTKKDSSQFFVLQVFENFSVSLDPNLIDESLQCAILKYDNGSFASTTLTEFKFGDILLINIAVKPEYLHYKNIKSLMKANSTADITLNFNEDNSEALYEFSVNAKNAGSYFAEANNIKYDLIIRTIDETQGFVKYGTTNDNRTSITQKIEQGGEYVFVAEPISNSYAFEKWCWIDEEGEPTDALRGQPVNNVLAGRTITIGFGKDGISASITYLNFDADPEIPYIVDSETGNISFVIEAHFTTNVRNLNIQSLLDADACNIYINGELLTIIDFLNLFDESVQVGVSIEIRVEMKEGYIFKKWRAGGSRPLANYISNDETETSQTINLTISDNFVLFLEVEQEEQTVQDTTWIWILVGALGGAGLIALSIILIRRSSKKKDFLNYF